MIILDFAPAIDNTAILNGLQRVAGTA